jgi:hypothetical protein
MKSIWIALLVLVLGTVGLSQTTEIRLPELREEFIWTWIKPKPIPFPPPCPGTITLSLLSRPICPTK